MSKLTEHEIRTDEHSGELLKALDGFSANAKATFESVDEDRLAAFIRSQPEIVGEPLIGDLEYLGHGAGASNGIAFFDAGFDQGGGPRNERLVLRYATGFRLLKQKSFADEFWTIRAAGRAGLPVPSVLWLDAEGSAVGRPCYVSTRVEGRSAPMGFLKAGPIAEADPEIRRQMLLELAGLHGRLKRLAIGPEDVPHLALRGQGASAIERELSWWLNETRLIARRPGSHLDVLEAAFKWLIENQPSVYSPRLAHGDAQIPNAMFDQGRIAALIDWELAYLGHNEADLALIVHHSDWAREAADGSDGIPSESEYIERFERESGTTLSAWPYFKAFLRFKAATATYLAGSMMPEFEKMWASQTGSLHAAIAQADKDR